MISIHFSAIYSHHSEAGCVMAVFPHVSHTFESLLIFPNLTQNTMSTLMDHVIT
jgi:hypothetical protein